MNNTDMGKYTAGFGLSLVITTLLNAIILLVKETSPPVMNVMKSMLGHHWITHGVLGFIFSGMKLEDKLDAGKLLKYIVGAVIVSCVIIMGFYLPNLKVASMIKY